MSSPYASRGCAHSGGPILVSRRPAPGYSARTTRKKLHFVFSKKAISKLHSFHSVCRKRIARRKSDVFEMFRTMEKEELPPYFPVDNGASTVILGAVAI
eukprot:767014-Prorocentrum_minimum.AAC.1